MKHPLIIFSLAILLSACGGGSRSSTACSETYWNGDIGTCIADGWEIVDRETLRQRGVPEETVVAFQSSESVSGQFPTVAITRERLAKPASAGEYSRASIRSVEVLQGYEMVDTTEMSIDGEKVALHIFTAQPIDGEPRRRFYQVSTTVDDDGYTATAVSPVSIGATLEKQMLLILENLTFEEQTEEEEK